MKTRILRAEAVATLLFAVLGGAALASPFYDYKIVAQTGTSVNGHTFSSFGSNPSVNNQGKVAFIATAQTGGQGVFVGDINGNLPAQIDFSSSRQFKSVSINSAGVIAASSRNTSAPVFSSVRVYYQGGGGYLFTNLARGSTDRLPNGDRVCPFDDVLSNVSLADNGSVAYGAVLGNQSWLTEQTAVQGFPNGAVALILSGAVDYAPAVAADGTLVVRAGGLITSPLNVYGPNLHVQENIAGQTDFLRIGQCPSISGDGQVVVFYGEINADKAQAFTRANRDLVPFPVTPGRGIFASVKINGQRHIVRVAGEIRNGVIDPGERWVKTASGTYEDRGQDYNFSGSYEYLIDYPYDWEITSFDADSAVGVSSAASFKTPNSGKFFTIAYAATDVRGIRGIYTSRVNVFLNPLDSSVVSVGVEAPIRVIKTGDGVGGLGSISQAAFSGSVNQSGNVTFWAKVGPTEAVLVAMPTLIDAIRNPPQSRFDPDSPIVEYIVPAAGNPNDIGNRTYKPRLGEPITQIVMHATDANESAALRSTLGVLAGTHSVSAHYLVSREGRVTQIVREQYRAFHAADARQPSDRDGNYGTIGIELVDEGPDHLKDHRTAGWATAIQYKKAALLVRDIAGRNGIIVNGEIPHPIPSNDKLYPAVAKRDYVAGTRVSPEPFPVAAVPEPFGVFEGYQEDIVGVPWTSYIWHFDGFPPTELGVIGHEQVFLRTSGKDDPRNFDWEEFMCMVNSGIAFTLNSPANLLVTDPQGRRTGYDPGSAQTLLEIPGSQFTGPGTEPQSLSIPDATNGNYTIQVIGTSNGVFHLDILASGMDAGLTQTQVAATTAPGALTTYTLNHDSVSGAGTTVVGVSNLPPVAYDDFATTVSNTPVAIQVLANDNDPEGFLNTNSVVIVTNPVVGTAVFIPTNSTITYTPPIGFIGTNTFAYTVQDNQGAVSVPAIVTIIVTEPMVTTNPPPIALNDSATTTNGIPVTINVLANDISTNGILDPSTVTITRAATNGTTRVDAYSGAVTYTPNSGATNYDSFRYTVQDDLGTPSNEAAVTVVVFGAPQQLNLTSAPYWVRPASAGATDHRYPMLNNLGGFVYNEQVGGQWQVFGTPSADVNPGQLTVPEGGYTEALSPGIADDGSFICTRSYTNNGAAGQKVLTDVLRYPGPAIAVTNPAATYVFQAHDYRNVNGYGVIDDGGLRASLSCSNTAIFSYSVSVNLMFDGYYSSYLSDSARGMVSLDDQWQGDYPDQNADGHFVFGNGSQVYLDNNPLLTGQFAHINDAPRDNPEIVYMSGNNLMSSRVGQFKDYNGQALAGSWVDINRSGVLIFEKLLGANYQIFKAYPTEPRIVSTGGTNGLVGLPYRYDSDNIAEAYGDPEPDDPRNITPIYWSKVSGPTGFHIDAITGHIDWIPDAPGTYTVVISAAFTYLDDYTEVEDQQALTIQVVQSTFDVVDAVDFRSILHGS